MQTQLSLPVTEVRRSDADKEIKAKQQEVKYDLRDFTIDYIVQQFQQDLFYVPEYQREFIWRPSHKYRFIESLVLGLPIPMMFVASMDDGRLEIVDGAQRIQTLEEFLSGDLQLEGLAKLPSLNGFRYEDMSVAQQRKFSTRALRIVVLEDSTTPETRHEIFDRVNTSGDKARPAEIRRGAFTGSFMDFVKACARKSLFRELCPISEGLQKRREDEELVLRFFAYSDRYKKFQHDVNKFLDKFVQEHKDTFEQERMEREFDDTLAFVKRNLPDGFAKNKQAKTTPRVRFEAISVGVNLALRTRPGLVASNVSGWLDSDEFKTHTTTHASNSSPRLRGRIEFVRDQILAGVGK